jgi:hypothetical protein
MMTNEVDLIKEALDKTDLVQLIEPEPDWDRYIAEQIVYFLHRRGYGVISDTAATLPRDS